uniref:Uncharacterized protein n=1 Tax=Setaria italica TaxID=4555 RepID=K3YNN0_SETIT
MAEWKSRRRRATARWGGSAREGGRGSFDLLELTAQPLPPPTKTATTATTATARGGVEAPRATRHSSEQTMKTI